MIITSNRKAFYEYHILEEYDAGIVLLGTEVKSIRASSVSISEAFIYIKDGEVWIKNMRVSRYKQMHACENHDENRDKKLLLNKKEIQKIGKSLYHIGVTCVPLSIFTKKNKIKLKLGVAKGKKLVDKRESIKERDQKREMQRISSM
jgi:SsrA-binding protein